MDLQINIVLILLAATGLAGCLISIIFIHEFLKRRNDKTPDVLFVAFHISKFGKKYIAISRGEKRKTGTLYAVYILSLSIFILSGLLLFLVNIIVM